MFLMDFWLIYLMDEIGKYVNENPYLAAPRNYAFMLNVDWF